MTQMTEAASTFGRLRRDALYRVDDVRALDRIAIEEFGMAGVELMERAGLSAWRSTRARWPQGNRIAILCGGGNNGGDGFVFARLAAQAGLQPEVFALDSVKRTGGDAGIALQRMRKQGVRLREPQQFQPAQFDVVVDALFGTGLSRALDGAAAQLVHSANDSQLGRIALDIPSGLDGDTGRALGVVFDSDLTVSFVALKQGLFTADARAFCGEILLDDLQIPDDAYARTPVRAWRVEPARLLSCQARPLGERDARAHKGLFGHVLVIGGEHGFGGAARLCAEACARCGAGLVSVATRTIHVPALISARPELMAHGIESATALPNLLQAASVVAIGPGLGRNDWGRELLATALADAADRPVVLDADALNLLAEPTALKIPLQCVMTPHPGEAARLLDCSTAQVEADRFAAVKQLVERYRCVVLLKGAGTLVAGPSTAVHVIEGGNPGMASGGMGDVLTGIIASLLAQGLPAIDAAVVGAALHAMAADTAASRGGERGLLAADLFAPLRRLVEHL
ncbi:MAG: hydroxyethylthiazole kinase-like uncharacterized protein yjeF [Gammaproteobacteria bacterium]|jgi:hydroxyethylthiazole kinase-like uncharacterized protein yjeF